jgi:hypothetical protein
MYKTSEKTTRRIALTFISGLLVLAMLAVLLPLQHAGAVGLAVTCSTYHSVASGETLSSISVKYNVSVQEIASANDLKEPYQIFVGQRLCIPGSASATTSATETASTIKGPNFTIKATKNPYTIEIATVGYAAKTPFYVRIIRNDQPKAITTKLGTIKTNKSGVGTRTFRIPKAYRDASTVTICLKNTFTDGVQCNSYTP